MKICIQSPSQSGHIDPPVHDILRQLPNQAGSDADVFIVPVTWVDGFQFNEDAFHHLKGKRWVLCNFIENGWDWNQQSSYLWGADRISGRFDTDEWRKFDAFVRDHPPILTFQRELLQKDVSERVLPIEYVSSLPGKGNDTKEEFLKRPLEVSYNWGRSHEARMWMHGAIFQNAGRFGCDVVTQFDHVDKAISDNPSSLKWLAVHAPHYSRLDVKEVQKIIQKSKITIVLPGCGVKCFRHGETCADAIMAIPQDDLAWSYPWTNENSIVLPPFSQPPIESLKQIADALMRTDLYELYCRAMENARNYRVQEYLRRWVIGNIEKVL